MYESGDLPEADQQEENSEEENECIEKMHISVSDSFSKFKGKQVGGSVDFSDRISRKIRTGYKYVFKYIILNVFFFTFVNIQY